MKYDAGDKHYTAILPSAAAGEYKAAYHSVDINGEKVNGRFEAITLSRTSSTGK